MKVEKILTQHRNDFTATMKCEHCSHEQKNSCGYFDAFYFEHVIPAMKCDKCGRDSKGDAKQTQVNET